MRTITTTAGTPVEIDGDVLAVIEAISRDLTRRKELDYAFDEVDREFEHLVQQLTDAELRVYLKESLFMSFNRFETDRMLAIVKKARAAVDGLAAPAKKAPKARAKTGARRIARKTTGKKKAGTKKVEKKKAKTRR